MEDHGTNLWTNSTAAVSFASSHGGSVISFQDTVFICGKFLVITVILLVGYRCDAVQKFCIHSICITVSPFSWHYGEFECISVFSSAYKLEFNLISKCIRKLFFTCEYNFNKKMFK
jgi:hypothetical protein